MANEITIQTLLTATKGGAQVKGQGTLAQTMAGTEMIANVQIIATAGEAITFGDVTTIGRVYLKNMDAANFITISLDSGATTYGFAKLLAGEDMSFPASTATLYAKADTSPCNLFVVACER